jgi:hypothetical protein
LGESEGGKEVMFFVNPNTDKPIDIQIRPNINEN